MNFTALSGGIPIGGCHFVIELDGKRIAIDFGAVQRGRVIFAPPVASGHIDALLLTHGHLDHVGMLPLFLREHPETPIYSTKVTWRYTRMLLWDSFQIAAHKLARGEHVEISFSAAEITKSTSLKRFKLVHNSDWFSPWLGWKIRFRSSGHINGAATIDIVSPSGFRTIHSGDISFHNQPTIKGAKIADDFTSPELLIIEATYGDRDLPKREEENQRLVNKVIDVLNHDGKVLIPSFGITGPNVAVIVADGLAKAEVKVPVYIDGMIRTAARIINGSNEWSPNDNGLVFADKNIVIVPENKEEARYFREEIIDGGSAVIVSSHGMLEGGLVMFYLPHILTDYKSAILIPGYQAEGTGGKRLLELEKGSHFPINRRFYSISCEVERFHLSSHASGKELAAWISEVQPWQVVVTHATNSGFEGLKSKIKERQPSIRIIGGYNGQEIRNL